MNLSHIYIPRRKHATDIFNIQTINNYCSRLKNMNRFKGIATKYLSNYFGVSQFWNFAKDSLENSITEFC